MTDQDRLAEIRHRLAAIDDGEQVIDSAAREFLNHAPADVNWLIYEVERLRGLLRQLEWMARLPVYGDGTEAGCPVCQQPRLPDGHAPTCWLAAELREEP